MAVASAKATAKRRTLLTSPHHDDVFLVSGSAEMRLYALGDGGDKQLGQPTDPSTAQGITLLHVNTRANARCVAWCPSKLDPFLIAAGTPTGQVVLHDCTPATVESIGDERPVRELGANLGRSCNAVAWNRALPHLIVAGLEFTRLRSSVLIWDIEQERAAAGFAEQSAASGDALWPLGGAIPAMPRRAFSCAHLAASQLGGAAAAVGRVAAYPGRAAADSSAHAAAPPPGACGGSGGRPASALRAHSSDTFLDSRGGGGAAAQPAVGGALAGVHGASAAALCATSFKLGREAPRVRTLTEPQHERSPTEGVAAVAWLTHYPKGILVGTVHKWLRMYDLRQSECCAAIIAHGRSVLGLECDPLQPHLFFTYSDDFSGVVKVWDTRMLEDNSPAFELQLPTHGTDRRRGADNITSVAWCATRPGCLATAQEHRSEVLIWSLAQLPLHPTALGAGPLGTTAAAAAGGGGGGAQSACAESGAAGGSSGGTVLSRGAPSPPPGGAGALGVLSAQLGGLSGCGGLPGGTAELGLGPSPPVLTTPARAVSATADAVLAVSWHRTRHSSLVLLTLKELTFVDLHSARPFAWAAAQHGLACANESAIDVYAGCAAARAADRSNGPNDSAADGSTVRRRPSHAGQAHATQRELLGAAGDVPDVGERMRLRALAGYALDMEHNVHVVESEAEALRELARGCRVAGTDAAAAAGARGAVPTGGGDGGGAGDGALEHAAAEGADAELPQLWRLLVRMRLDATAERAAEDDSRATHGLASTPSLGAPPHHGGAHSAHTQQLRLGALHLLEASADAETDAEPNAQIQRPPLTAGRATHRPAHGAGGGGGARAPPQQTAAGAGGCTSAGAASAEALVDGGTPLATAEAAAGGARAPDARDGDPRGMAASLLGIPLFESEARAAVLKMCGWPLARDVAALEADVCRAEACGEHERGAVLAMLHGQFTMAVEALRAGAVDGPSATEAGGAAKADGGATNGASGAMRGARDARAAHATAGAGARRAADACAVATHAQAPAERRAQLQLLAAVLAGHPRAAFASQAPAAPEPPSAAECATTAAEASEADCAYPPASTRDRFHEPRSAEARAAAGLWEATVRQLVPSVHCAQLRLLVELLGASEHNAERVLAQALHASAHGPVGDATRLQLCDALAFACRFSALRPLLATLRALSSSLCESGKLDGLVLVGATSAGGIQLLQAYLDRTGDVQTVALVAQLARAGMAPATTAARAALPPAQPARLAPHARAHNAPGRAVAQPQPASAAGGGAAAESEACAQWLECYRSLLDRWRLWHERARLDCALRALHTDAAVLKPHILVKCAFCNAPVGGGALAAPPAAQSQARAAGARQGGMRAPVRQGSSRAMACHNCGKPLPRCAICLLHLGEGLRRQPLTGPDGGAFDDWFAWCQSCHHGGHARHLSEWFATHDECPVSNCRCRCSQLDPASCTV
ncbi:hypothetical protein KFE25_002522 [Diacronema lutheri]|uniref:WD repeat protein mio zinc-ribbon like domain-containing protein n=1 Tax=Diacronema lutheri TaxID=2081491 RepID=A0A8J5XGJ3_DIALT|nr:hypothetical protein KFE25_002522 [Diacronema lutheri]